MGGCGDVGGYVGGNAPLEPKTGRSETVEDNGSTGVGTRHGRIGDRWGQLVYRGGNPPQADRRQLRTTVLRGWEPATGGSETVEDNCSTRVGTRHRQIGDS